MKRIISKSEALGTVNTAEGERELCIALDAEYDEGKRQLVVRSETFLRNTDLITKETYFTAAWLPKAEIVRESVNTDEAVDMAEEIFTRWTRKVRQSAPALHHH